ncbi:MAG: glycine oxidase ThiO [Gammaproteobacteria bacterium]
MHLDSDIFIIGGGISGLLTARELCLAGHDITIIDKSDCGREASWAGGGILLPIYPWRQAGAISDLVASSLKRYPILSKELSETTGIDPEWRPCGMLICKNPDHGLAENWCRSYDIQFEPAPTEKLDQLNTETDHPLWLPGIAQARNPRLLKSLKAYLIQKGVKIVEHSQITGIKIEQRCIARIDTNGSSFMPRHVVLCTGAWTAEWLKHWLPSTELRLPIEPVRGQMLVFDADPDTLDCMVLDGDHYLIPRRDGKILAGSTVEHAGFEKATTEQAKDSLYRFATDLLPTLKKYAVCEHWAGLRPGSPDGVPYIGRHPELDNLTINAGHFRNGLVMGPASAALTADLILQRPLHLNPQPYALNRQP